MENFLYHNVGASISDVTKQASGWGKKMESEGRFPFSWCIMDGVINIIGDVDLRGTDIEYPIGVVNGKFLCDKESEISPNYPQRIVNI